MASFRFIKLIRVWPIQVRNIFLGKMAWCVCISLLNISQTSYLKLPLSQIYIAKLSEPSSLLNLPALPLSLHYMIVLSLLPELSLKARERYEITAKD